MFTIHRFSLFHSSFLSLPFKALIISHLDANKVDGNDGPLQRGQTGFIQRFSHHGFGCHADEVHADGFGHKREGARCPQVTFNHLKHDAAVKTMAILIKT